jgi:hypothetical protein
MAAPADDGSAIIQWAKGPSSGLHQLFLLCVSSACLFNLSSLLCLASNVPLADVWAVTFDAYGSIRTGSSILEA